MKYIYQYDIAAIIINTVMLLIFFVRNKYQSRGNRIFRATILCNYFASVFDLISCFTISYPEDYSLVFNYIVSLGYLFFYNMMALFYFRYIDCKGKIGSQRKVVRVTCVAFTVFYAITIFSSPWTRWVAYFDENLVYSHGPLFNLLFAIPFLLFFWEIYIFIEARDRFTNYQLLASISMIVGMASAVFISILIPKALVGEMVMATIMFFVYVTYENPTYYCFGETQCLNARALNEKMLEMNRFDRKLNAVVIRIDNYALLRSTYNDAMVDIAVKRIADMLFKQFRRKAYNVSYDRFLVILDDDNYDEVFQKIKRLFNSPLQADGVFFKIDYSTFRVNVKTEKTSILNQVIANTDSDVNDLTFKVKYADINEQRIKKEKMLNAIRNAIKNDSFEVFFQPIRNMHNGKFESAEALIRLEDPEIGFVNPEELIVMAEKNGLINDVGNAVFSKVCKAIHDEQLEQLGIHYIEVNLSPVQLLGIDLLVDIFRIMKQYNVRPDQLNLEITETAEASASMISTKNVQILHSKGLSFSIDDYGSGFASSHYLTDYPINIVKIDKMILWQAMEDNYAMKIFIHTVRLIKDLGKKIVVEGVETEEMLDLIKSEDCDYCQGYYYSKPLRQDDFVKFLKREDGNL